MQADKMHMGVEDLACGRTYKKEITRISYVCIIYSILLYNDDE